LQAHSSLTTILSSKARSKPNALALVVSGVPLTYGAWHSRSDWIAAGLQKAGVGKGDVVVSILSNRVEQPLIWMACMKIGAVWASINVGLVGSDLRYTLLNA